MTRHPQHSLTASTAVAGLIAALVIIGAGVVEAWPHEAIPSATQPLGWTYDYSCCSVTDCSQVRDGGVTVTEYGYKIATTGEVIPWSDKRIKRSKDEFYHRCTPGGNEAALRSLCLYVPRGLF